MSIKEAFKPLARAIARGLQKTAIPSTILGPAKRSIDETMCWVRETGTPVFGCQLTSVAPPHEEHFDATIKPVSNSRLDSVCKIQPAKFVLRFPDYTGRIYGDGCVITPDDGILRAESGIRKKLIKHHVALTRLRYPTCKKKDATIAPIAYGSPNNYYHWLFEILPRIQILKEASCFDEIDFFVLSDELPFQRDTLSSLGIRKDQILKTGKSLHISPRTLLLPSVAGNAEAPSKWVCQWLRKNFRSENHQKPTRRLFVDRGKVKRRQLLNQDELWASLASRGFERVNPGQLSFKEQVRIFSSAEVVIGVHGAALANLVFCSPGTTVIELFSPWYINPVYRFICQHIELNYLPLIGIGDGPENDDLANRCDADVAVELKTIEQLLDSLSAAQESTPSYR